MQAKMECSEEVKEDDFKIYRHETSEGSQCTFLRAPTKMKDNQSDSADTFNILMADVSASMGFCWKFVVDGWNEHIAKTLTGETELFVFDHKVTFLRKGTNLEIHDMTSGSTNITQALKQIQKSVNSCKQGFVQVFFVTDGGHTERNPYPEEVIETMESPPGKIVNVHLLGVTDNFPVNYSIDIRSRLHSGSATLPSLYWAREQHEILEQMEAIGSNLVTPVRLELNQEAFILPGLPPTKSLHLGDWLYFPKAPEEVPSLKVRVNDEEEREIPKLVKEPTVSILLDNVFPQWNSILIKQHRNKQHVPMEIFNLMESLFQWHQKRLEESCNTLAAGIRSRLARKQIKTVELKYRELMNRSRSVIEVEGKYMNEIELANNILKSTVSGHKYETKVLKLRGHGLDDYEKDKEEFFKIYKQHKEAIRALPQPHPEECCRITMSSTLTDLQDEHFMLMEDAEKFEFLKTFTMSGIPAYAPVTDAQQINPWTLIIRHILVTPFTVLSQRAIEAYAGVEGEGSLGATDKDIKLQADDENTRFNIVIPTVPASAGAVLKPLVCSKLYAMLATFSILKNPHTVDFSAHLAALACAWVKSVSEHPPANRPEYVTDRLASIVVTAELYMDRIGITRYLEALGSTPNMALMTETTDPVSNQPLKCESLVKPLFLLGMRKENFSTSQLISILRLILAEFIGRCLSNYKVHEKKPTPFTDFFATELTDPSKRKEWLAKESKSMIEEFKSSTGDLLKKFYTPEAVQKEYKKLVNLRAASIGEHLTKSISLTVNMKKVKPLKYIGGCGDVTFQTFTGWAQEIGVPEEEICAAIDPSQVAVYVCEALTFRSSKERLDREMRSYNECMEHIKLEVSKENGKTLLENFKDMSSKLVEEWTTQYMKVHEPLVMPLTVQQIVSQAQEQNIDVTEETFYNKYKYNAKSGLLHNACQVQGCPYYLHPNRSFNQHISVERTPGKFPHSLHLVSMELNFETVDRVLNQVISGEHSGRNGRKKHPISETQFLQRLKPSIQELQKQYSHMLISN